MATSPVVNQGKTVFVEKYFTNNPAGNLESVNQAWTAAGNAGSVSESLVGKVRARLGLTGRKAVDEPQPTDTPTNARSKSPARARKVEKPVEETPTVANGTHAPAGIIATTGHEDDDILDELEEDIDGLIQRIRELGGRPEVVRALKRARRLLFHSHGG